MRTNVDDVTSENTTFTFKMTQWMKFMMFVQCIWSKVDHFTGNLDANTIEKELYIILSTLERNLRWNWTCNNFNKVEFSMENHTFSTYLGIK